VPNGARSWICCEFMKVPESDRSHNGHFRQEDDDDDDDDEEKEEGEEDE